MIDITIKGDVGEGKTRTANAIRDYWHKQGRTVQIVEGYNGIVTWDKRKPDVLIKTIQA